MVILRVAFPLIVLYITLSMNLYAIVPIPGYGAKSQAMAGVGVALPLDTFVMVSNPAAIAFLDDSYDIGLAYIKPNDKVTIDDNELIPHKRYKSTPDPLVPGFGLKKDFCGKSFGLISYGRGAGVHYGHVIPIFGTTKVKANYNQLIVKPCFAYSITSNIAIGIGVNLVISYFNQGGAENFKTTSESPNHVTNRGYDYRPGAGIHIGVMSRLLNNVKVGISYDSEIFTHRFNKYQGLLAEHGKANGPSILALGISYEAFCKLTIAFDYQCYFWKQIRALSNDLTFTEPGGSKEGSGFGWRNENRYRVGVSYQLNDNLTLRAGYMYIEPFFAKSQLFLNIDTTVVFSSHYPSAGFTWQSGCHEISLAYTQAVHRKIEGDLPAPVGGGRIRTDSTAHMVGISYTHKL